MIKFAFFLVVCLLVAGCLGPAIESLGEIRDLKSQLYTQLLEATDPDTKAILRKQIEGLDKTEELVLVEATAERVAAREKRSTLFGLGSTVLQSLVAVGLAVGKKVFMGGLG